MSTRGFLSWSASWAADRSLPQWLATRIPWHIAQVQYHEEHCMNDVTAQPSSSASRVIAPDAGIALGLGLTNECNLACAFCYRDPTRTDRLSLDQVKSVMERLPIRSVNLGTGENGMHPEFKAILAYLRKKPIKLTITSNGHRVAVLEDNELRAFHDIEFSLDYPTQAETDAQRGE